MIRIDRSSTAPRLSGASTRGPARRWVFLGTGTGVGKSFAAVGLVRTFVEMKAPVAGLKPIETGLASGPVEASDSFQLSAASLGLRMPAAHPLYSFAEPVTPARAARHAGTVIDLEAVRSWVEAIATDAPASAELIIESAGGVFSPLGDAITNFELARALEPATWILVGSDRLGVLHDIASCWIAMTALGRPPDCIVLSAPEHADPSTGTNCEELARNPRMPPILSLPRGDIAPLRTLAMRAREPKRD